MAETGYFPELAPMAATFERTSAALALKRRLHAQPLVLALELEQALVFRGPGRGLGGDAGLAVAFDPRESVGLPRSYSAISSPLGLPAR